MKTKLYTAKIRLFKSKNTYKDTTYSFCMLVAYLRLKKRNRGNQIISMSWKNI